MSPFDYYLQDDKTQSVRRFQKGAQTGERWNRKTGKWTEECADRRSCELTQDRIISGGEVAPLLT